MANDLNQITVSGRLGRDPKLTVTSNGCPVARFSLAYQGSGFGQQTSWLNISVFGDLAAPTARRITKGQHVTVVGRIEAHRSAEGKYYSGIIAEDVQKNDGPKTRENLNLAIVSGRLGRTPEYRLVGKKGDQPMLSFSLAVTHQDSYTWEESTTWLNLVAWGEEATRLYQLNLTKGCHLTGRGRLETRSIGEGEERRYYSQVVLESLSVNDYSQIKRSSGQGNGAEPFAHPSQNTTFERYTNEHQPNEIEAAATFSRQLGFRVVEITPQGQKINHGEIYSASPTGKQAARDYARRLGQESGRPQAYQLELAPLQ